jgi:tRNA dimethylallyltransferase
LNPIAIFGPTGVGKTGVAVELSRLLSDRGEGAVAVNCDSIQVYRGLEVISGAATGEVREQLEHRLLSFLPIDEEFSAGRYATLAHAEIDTLLAEGRTPLVVGGTGLYLRAALSDLDFRPPVPPDIRSAVEDEIRRRGSAAVHSDLPAENRDSVHPNDRKRIARTLELLRTGADPAPPSGSGGELWTARLRHPSLLVGLADDDEALTARIRQRVEQMERDGARREAVLALESGASRTAMAAIGLREFLDGNLDAVVAGHRRFGRRQMTWMRRMEGVNVLERGGRDDAALAAAIFAMADGRGSGDASDRPSG